MLQNSDGWETIILVHMVVQCEMFLETNRIWWNFSCNYFSKSFRETEKSTRKHALIHRTFWNMNSWVKLYHLNRCQKLVHPMWYSTCVNSNTCLSFLLLTKLFATEYTLQILKRSLDFLVYTKKETIRDLFYSKNMAVTITSRVSFINKI